MQKLKIFALIGYPIGHTLSPYMHMRAYAKLNISAIYIPLLVEPEKLKETINALKRSRIDGFNVTIPFKTACMKYLDCTDKFASMIGAVNTISITNNKLTGHNTDASGFLKALKQELKFNPKNKSCLVVGAGGAARAVCFALAKERARKIFITDVIKSKAVSLAGNVKKYFPKCEISTTPGEAVDLLVNATPAGMKKSDKLPIDAKILQKGLKVYDLVYNQSPTKLVKKARQKGLIAQNGLSMLLYQGAEAFEIWFKKKAPVDAMRKALNKQAKKQLC
ncbi:MAG: shikimate dehydrogenase [Candidatus Omnitrophica bacterium]|nr:shikimate dehydrogenase [Candidatus Omnitrophota bacterium]